MERRKIIMQEIVRWRESNVLPAHYCDFLMNLYREEHDDEVAATMSSSWRSVSKSSIRNSHWKVWALISVIILAVCLLIINFKHFPFLVQLGISLTIVLFSYIVGIAKIKSSKIMSYAFLGIGTIGMLWSGQYLLKAQGYEESMWLVGYLVICSIIWIVMGLSLNLGMLQFCGWLGIVMVYGWLFHTRVDGMHWLPVQLLWLPLTLFFIWIGWLLQQRHKQAGFIYCVVGLLLWFVPDVYLIFVVDRAHAWMQILLVFKMGVTVAILYLFRKKWTEWVV